MAEPGKWTFTDTTVNKILNGTFRLTADTIHCALFLSTSNISTASTTYAGLTNQVANATNIYTTGGNKIGPSSPTNGTAINLSGGDLRFLTYWEPTAGNLTARYAVVYKASGDVIMYCVLDSAPADYTCLSGRRLTINCSGAPVPALRLAVA